MKDHFEKNQERLSAAERDSLWDAIRGGTTARRKRLLVPKWRPLWLYAPAAAAAVIAVVLFVRFGTDGPRLSPLAERMIRERTPAAGPEEPRVRLKAEPEPRGAGEQAEPHDAQAKPQDAPAEPHEAQAEPQHAPAHGEPGAADAPAERQDVESLEAPDPYAFEAPAAGGERQAADTSPAAASAPGAGLDMGAPGARHEAARSVEADAAQGASRGIPDEEAGTAGRQAAPVPPAESAAGTRRPRAEGLGSSAAKIARSPGASAASPEAKRGGVKSMYSNEQPPLHPSTGGTTEPNDRPYDSMFFQHYGVNPFIATEDDALSTFALDVDAASYTLARRYIELGHLPDPAEPRVEEFVNFFGQDYPPVVDDFGIFIDGAPSRFADGYHLLRIGIKARTVETGERPRANLVFVIDVSGSMAREDRLELVKRALGLLVRELREDDRVGIVVYGSDGRVRLQPTTIRDARRIQSAIAGLSPEGSTNAEEGLLLGYEMARRIYRDGEINRIILCSDGVANVGRTGPDSILERVRGEADRGIYLTTVGFGMGNFNDVLMEQLANRGDGNYYYVDSLDEARRVFVENLTGTLQTVARDAKVQVEFDPQRVDRYRLLGFENRDVADRDFRNDAIDAGEIGAGHEVTALYEIKLTGRTSRGRIAIVRLRYTPPGGEEEGPRRAREITRAFDARQLARTFETAAPRFKLAATVAEFAEILRHSYWAKESRIEDLVPIARGLDRQLRNDPAVGEFADMVARASGLSDKLSPEERGRRGGDDDWPAGLEEPFTLGPGEWVDLGPLAIGFDRVLVDNRCPPDVRCYWEGEARLSMWSDDGSGRDTFELSTYRPKIARIAGYEIELLTVWPPPRGASRPIDNTEALIELVVRPER